MKRILRYFKNRKGFSIVLLAISLAALLMIAGLAIDISYMYYGKNQLQVAADAAALAGVIKIGEDGAGRLDKISLEYPEPLKQEKARQEAWKFACKNKAAHRHVFLVSDGGIDPLGPDSDCDNLPNASNLNQTNDPNGDIVVGYWKDTPFTCNSTLRAGEVNPVNFCPANGSTENPINAIQVYPRKTADSPNGAARLFIGQIFRIIGADWSFMSARAEAIASHDFEGSAGLTLCFESCLPGSFSPPVSPANPVLLYFAPFPDEMQPGHGTAWTVFDEDSPSIPTQEVIDFFCEDVPEACYRTIHADNGARNNAQRAFRCAFYDPLYDSGNKTCEGGDGKCDSSSDTVKEWRVKVPVFTPTEEDPNPCPPGNEPLPKYVEQYAVVTIIEVYASGGSTSSCSCEAFNAPPSPPASPNAILVTGISCVDCSDIGDLGLQAKLVK